MIEDPIVEEIYQTRQRMLDECDGDLMKLIERQRAAEAKDRERVVSLRDVQRRRRDTRLTAKERGGTVESCDR